MLSRKSLGDPQCVKVSHLFHTGLSIDFEKEQLYWISSGNSTINRCNMDGSKLEVLEGVKGKLTKATALAIMGETKVYSCRFPTSFEQRLEWSPSACL